MTDQSGAADDGRQAILIAVDDDLVDDLVAAGIVQEIPTLRGPIMDTAMQVGADAAVLVSLMQGPDTIRSFAEWIRRRGSSQPDGITITGHSGDRTVSLTVEAGSDLPVDAVADFVRSALTPPPDPPLDP